MSILYALLAELLILNWTAWPWSTLMSVANPWMVESPAPDTPQVLWGVPASWFSVTMALAGTTRSSSPFKVSRARRALAAAGRGARRGRRLVNAFIDLSKRGGWQSEATGQVGNGPHLRPGSRTDGRGTGEWSGRWPGRVPGAAAGQSEAGSATAGTGRSPGGSSEPTGGLWVTEWPGNPSNGRR